MANNGFGRRALAGGTGQVLEATLFSRTFVCPWIELDADDTDPTANSSIKECSKVEQMDLVIMDELWFRAQSSYKRTLLYPPFFLMMNGPECSFKTQAAYMARYVWMLR